MNQNAQYELYQIKKDLGNVISELNDIAYLLRKQFSGIGSELCADCISRVASNYQRAKNKLENMDTSAVTEEFAASHPNE